MTLCEAILAEDDRLQLLTSRDRLIIQSAVGGQTNRQIAEVLGLTPGGVYQIIRGVEWDYERRQENAKYQPKRVIWANRPQRDTPEQRQRKQRDKRVEVLRSRIERNRRAIERDAQELKGLI